jgi:hypothetical protein
MTPNKIARRKEKKKIQVRRALKGHKKKSIRRKRVKYQKLHGRIGGQRRSPIKKVNRGFEGQLDLPENFSLKNNRLETLKFFSDLDDLTLKEKAGVIRVRHKNLKQIDPEVALILMAAFSRITELSPQLKILGDFGQLTDEVFHVLAGVGYLEKFYRARRLKDQVRAGSRIYLRAEPGNQVSGQKAGELVEDFYKLADLDKQANKRICTCLVELMDNAMTHGYGSPTSRGKWEPSSKWWMLGYRDEKTGELYFALMDQGFGMPKTLKTRFIERGLLIPRNEEEMVLRAFNRSYSRTKQSNRGLGLPNLKKAALTPNSGELSVQTQNVYCHFKNGEQDQSGVSDIPLAGTLIVWKAKEGRGDEEGNDNEFESNKQDSPRR